MLITYVKNIFSRTIFVTLNKEDHPVVKVDGGGQLKVNMMISYNLRNEQGYLQFIEEEANRMEVGGR